MKKILMGCLLTICLMGCQNKEIVIKTGERLNENEQILFEIIKTEIRTDIEPSNKNDISQTIQAKDDYVFVDLLMKVENISQEEYKLKDMFSGRYEIDNMSYDLKTIMESSNYTKLTTTDSIKPSQERYVHFYSEIEKEESEKEIKLNLRVFKNQNYTHTFKAQEVQEENSLQSVGDVLSLKQAQITLNKIDQSSQIEPSQKGLFYSYIPAQDGKVFIYVQADIKNLSNETIELKDYIYCEYHDDQNRYQSQIITETDNHKSLEKGGAISSLATKTVYLAIPVPENNVNKQGEIHLFVEGETYHISYNVQ